LDSAIAPHLQCPRTQPRRMLPNHVPPFPATTARFPLRLQNLVMAYLGLQYRRGGAGRGAQEPAGAGPAQLALCEALAGSWGPGQWERAHYVDQAGYDNALFIAYWSDPAQYERWYMQHGRAWVHSVGRDAALGAFVEVLKPSVQRVETLYASELPQGVGVLAEGFSAPVQEHGYWGSMRDRMPAAQTDPLKPAGALQVITRGLHQRVIPQDKLCLIRSGQDWSAAGAEERRMYLHELEPVLRAGMHFLRDQGQHVGCYANRYLQQCDAQGQALDKTFAMGWWNSLAALEAWAESHPTHVSIFGAAMKYLGSWGADARLRLYHEVSVAAASEQFFDYYNCHAATGLLGAAERVENVGARHEGIQSTGMRTSAN